MAGISYKGIYCIDINGRKYIGKDSRIFSCKRFKEHLKFLETNTHYNKEMQADFNKYGLESVTYTILNFDLDYSEEELRELEKYYVKKFDTYKNGYNETIGGVGMLGYKCSDETLEKKSAIMSGENNPLSKLKNSEFYEIVDLFKKGYTNQEIGELYGIHDRYVSLIRHKKRFKRLWKDIDYTPDISQKGIEQRTIDYNTYIKIRKDKENKMSNSKIEEKYQLSGGTASRICNGKIYKDFYEKYSN